MIALGDTGDVHHHAAQTAVRRLRDAAGPLLLPASGLAEVLVGPIQKHGQTAGRARVRRLLELLSMEVVPLDADIAFHAAVLRAQHGKRLRLPDALVVATAAHRGGSVLTTDGGWPSFATVRVMVVGRRGFPPSRPPGARVL